MTGGATCSAILTMTCRITRDTAPKEIPSAVRRATWHVTRRAIWDTDSRIARQYPDVGGRRSSWTLSVNDFHASTLTTRSVFLHAAWVKTSRCRPGGTPVMM